MGFRIHMWPGAAGCFIWFSTTALMNTQNSRWIYWYSETVELFLKGRSDHTYTLTEDWYVDGVLVYYFNNGWWIGIIMVAWLIHPSLYRGTWEVSCLERMESEHGDFLQRNCYVKGQMCSAFWQRHLLPGWMGYANIYLNYY